MQEERFKITKYENNPEWDRIDIKQKWSEWSIESHLGEEVIVTCSPNDGENHLFLNQEELKQVIEFLQSKVR